MADDVQEPQLQIINKDDIPESLIFSVLSDVTIRFKNFDLNVDKFRFTYLDNETQQNVVEVMALVEKTITEPNPDFNAALPESDGNPKNISYQVGEYVFTQDWLNDFYQKAFNGTSANLTIQRFHLNAQFLQVVDNDIFVAFKDSPIVTPIQGLIPLPYSAPFADIGIRGAVPQETPEGSDELSWKSGYTEPYQRPTNRDGKWIKMGQYNQILYDITKSALTLQDNLSILAGYINDEVDIKIDGVKDKIDNELSKPPANAVLLTGNQSVAGLKNFTGINANNFKNTPAAVANLEWCNGMPIKTTYKAEVFKIDTNYTINSKNTAYSIGCASASPNYTLSCFLDSKVIFKSRSYSENMGYIIGSNKQVFKATNENFITNMYYLYGQ